MWRVIIFLAVLAVLAFGAVWLADQPGGVALTVGGTSYATSLVVAAIAGVALIGAIVMTFVLARAILTLPTRVTRASRERRREKGLRALTRGMIAVGAGDEAGARRYATEAQRLLRRGEPLALLLRAQAAQISGDRESAERAFKAMAENGETRVLGLRGLYVEARRRGDAGAAWNHAREAARIAPAATWANEAVLEGYCAKGDWRAALDTVERRAALGLIDKPSAKRQRAVLLTAEALSRGEREEDAALRAAKEAVRLAPDLVPAAALAGRILGRRMELRKAASIVETAWKAVPHPELADVYTHLRIGDSARDRMARAERLARLSSWDPEGRLALARAALEARDFTLARQTLEPLLAERPSVRVCLLMAEIERGGHGASGRVREWLARAVHAPRDKAWIADGIVSERWSPVSPVSGRLDAFVWAKPPEIIAGAGIALVDEVVGDVEDEPREPIAIEALPKAERQAPAGGAADSEAAAASAAPEPRTPPEPATPGPRPQAASPETTAPPAAPEPASAVAKEPEIAPAATPLPSEALKKEEPKKEEPKRDEPKKEEPKKQEPKKQEPKKDESQAEEQIAEVSVLPPRLPDDPGASADEETPKRAKFRLFG